MTGGPWLELERAAWRAVLAHELTLREVLVVTALARLSFGRGRWSVWPMTARELADATALRADHVAETLEKLETAGAVRWDRGAGEMFLLLPGGGERRQWNLRHRLATRAAVAAATGVLRRLEQGPAQRVFFDDDTTIRRAFNEAEAVECGAMARQTRDEARNFPESGQAPRANPESGAYSLLGTRVQENYVSQKRVTSNETEGGAGETGAPGSGQAVGGPWQSHWQRREACRRRWEDWLGPRLAELIGPDTLKAEAGIWRGRFYEWPRLLEDCVAELKVQMEMGRVRNPVRWLNSEFCRLRKASEQWRPK